MARRPGPELILELSHVFVDTNDVEYRVQVWGEPRPDGTWQGWLEFASAGGSVILRTPRETVQRNREHLVSWASGLEPTSIEGAFQRAARWRALPDADSIGNFHR